MQITAQYFIDWHLAEQLRPRLDAIRRNEQFGRGIRMTAASLRDALDGIREHHVGDNTGQLRLNRYEDRLFTELVRTGTDPRGWSPHVAAAASTPMPRGIRESFPGAIVGLQPTEKHEIKRVKVSRRHGGHQIISVLVPAGLVALLAHYLLPRRSM